MAEQTQPTARKGQNNGTRWWGSEVIPEDLTTLQHLSDHLDRPMSTLRGWVKSGQLKAYGEGRRARFSLAEARVVDQTSPRHNREPEAPKVTRLELPGLRAYLEPVVDLLGRLESIRTITIQRDGSVYVRREVTESI